MEFILTMNMGFRYSGVTILVGEILRMRHVSLNQKETRLICQCPTENLHGLGSKWGMWIMVKIHIDKKRRG
jgi:hypothetical protein